MNLASLRSFRPSKTWIVLIVAVVIGSIAAFSASSFLSSRLADIEARSQGKTVNIVVAKHDLLRGDRLDSENVAVRPIPTDYAHSGAVRPEQFGSVEGETIAFDLKAGEILLWSLMESKKAPTFSTRIESGRRAITVAVDEINSISGLLEPGDLIDLLVTVDQKNQKVTVPLLQGVRVMATGQRSVDDPKSGERRLYSTVTLNTDPHQAQNVVVAREAGRITALLRNPQDNAPLHGAQGDLASLLGQRSHPGKNTEASTMVSVPVLYGGVGGRIPPEGLNLGQYAKPTPVEQQILASAVAAAAKTPASRAASAAEDPHASTTMTTQPKEVLVLSGGPATRPTDR